MGKIYVMGSRTSIQIMAGYYDAVLGLIPLVFVGVSAALLVFGLDMTTAVPIASLPAVGLMGHAMFVRAPTDEPAADSPSFQPAD